MSDNKPLHQVILSRETLIPVSMVIVLIGGIAWLTTMFATVQSNSRAILEIQGRLGAIEDVNENLLDRTARIETKIDILIDDR